MADEFGLAGVFEATFDGMTKATLKGVSGLKFEADVVEIKQNNDGKATISKVPGAYKLGELTLEKDLVDDQDDFATWFKLATLGKLGDLGKNGSIVIKDSSHGQEIRRYNVVGAFPKKLEYGTLKSYDNNTVSEKLTIVYTGLNSGISSAGLF